MVLFSNIYSAQALDKNLFPFVLTLASLSVLTIVLSLLLLSRTIKDKPRLTTMTQAIFRGNSVLFAVPVCLSVLGEKGATLAAQSVATTSAFSIVTVFFWMYFSSLLGLIGG